MSKVPETLRKIMNAVNKGAKAKDPAKNPAFNPVIRERDMAKQAVEDGSVNSDYLVRGTD